MSVTAANVVGTDPDTLSLDQVRRRILGCDAAVPVLDGGDVPYVNFDHAVTTPALIDVGMDRLIAAWARICRGEVRGTHEHDRVTGTFQERSFRPILSDYFTY